MARTWYLKLSPEEVWKKYMGDTVKLFISFYHVEDPPITDITEMCQRYAKDVCNSLGRPYSLEQLNHLAALFEEYINTYIEKASGYGKLIFYSCEEVEAIEDESIKELLEMIEWYKKRFLLL